jgi:hypothetical protein
MKRSFLVCALAGALALPLAAQESKKFEKTVALKPESQKLDLKWEKVTIESVRIRHWPDPDDFRKGERDLNDKHTVWVEFAYSNRDLDTNYKCRYAIEIPGPDGSLALADRTATLDKGKIGDTNKVSFKMRTNDYKTAKRMKLSFEIWKKL